MSKVIGYPVGRIDMQVFESAAIVNIAVISNKTMVTLNDMPSGVTLNVDNTPNLPAGAELHLICKPTSESVLAVNSWTDVEDITLTANTMLSFIYNGSEWFLNGGKPAVSAASADWSVLAYNTIAATHNESITGNTLIKFTGTVGGANTINISVAPDLAVGTMLCIYVQPFPLSNFNYTLTGVSEVGVYSAGLRTFVFDGVQFVG